MESVDTLVIGAGVVGLACARQRALSGRQVVVLEQADTIGTGISSRNSEVIHAGLYYPPHWLKTRLCVDGRALLYELLARFAVPHRRCGKLVVATDTGQLAALEALKARAEANGIEGMRRLTRQEARELEPQLRCQGALYSPHSGIVDSHQLMLALQGDLEHHGGTIAFGCGLERAHPTPSGLEVTTSQGRVRCRELLLATGLDTPALLAQISGVATAAIPTQHLAKGNYYSLAGPSPFSRLIYPLPEAAGLGVHLTLDLAGNARFGPDVQWCDARDYRVTPGLEEKFRRAVCRYWPGVAARTLVADYAGIRPKLSGPGQQAVDFALLGPSKLGVPGLVALAGIESPGLTASLALAQAACALLEEA